MLPALDGAFTACAYGGIPSLAILLNTGSETSTDDPMHPPSSPQVLWSTTVSAPVSLPARLLLSPFGELQLQDSFSNVMWSSKTKGVGSPPHTLQVRTRLAPCACPLLSSVLLANMPRCDPASLILVSGRSRPDCHLYDPLKVQLFGWFRSLYTPLVSTAVCMLC
jgi:hypothetical protein